MPVGIALELEGDGVWSDLAGRDDLVHVADGNTLRVTAVEDEMANGRPSVALRVELPDGRPLIVETSWALLHASVRVLAARLGEPR